MCQYWQLVEHQLRRQRCNVASAGSRRAWLCIICRHIFNRRRRHVASTGNFRGDSCQYWQHLRIYRGGGCVDFARRVDDGEGGAEGGKKSSPPAAVGVPLVAPLTPLAFMPRTSCCA